MRGTIPKPKTPHRFDCVDCHEEDMGGLEALHHRQNTLHTITEAPADA